ncbi:LPS translocon maturation chaperone LptM [[Haemophilus] ducreyi]|uniref:Lipoprotein n=2 Tax=Haemophilus ducreyi TaxID=730 RepID=Q7VPM6_HAEDU|nr:lipoprotein [[Haemophilus] ducreyi]AAP95050.1 hypothetical protein HD_0035 [[Haemophilus] ducreyi 35000HP]AKO30239.1 membrane protein [[Haemophilus] ducreyi]AKO31672.1 membrane protein [[Haemophilus] ducreyi]AKO33123.1 membrane protein [[Haemophilus] ducreyi]AKO34573.1 membrane protein [[Haemophilus] ducreyi]
MKKFIFTVLFASVALTACAVKGPLYFPTEQTT